MNEIYIIRVRERVGSRIKREKERGGRVGGREE